MEKFLRKITSCHKCGEQDVSDANLKKMFGTENVVANWYTGKIIIPKGELLHYIHYGYSSIYEEELLYFFKKGVNTKIKTKSNKKIAENLSKKINAQKEEQEIGRTLQDTLFYFVKNTLSWDTLVTPWYNLCDEKYILTYNSKGKIKKVWMDYEGETTGEKIGDWFLNNFDNRKCRKKIKKTLKPLKLSYLEIPNRKFKIYFEVTFERKTGELKLDKSYWFD